jgi:cytochrome P450
MFLSALRRNLREAMQADLDLFSPAFQADPFPTFAQMRTQDPVYQLMVPTVAGRKCWMVTRYEDVEGVLKDKRFTKGIRYLLSAEELTRLPHVFTKLSNNMLNSDPPDHTRLRSLISMTFTPRLVEKWRPRIQTIIDDLLDQVQEKGEMDLIEDFAFPLPATILIELFGIPDEDKPRFRTWSNSIVEAIGDLEALLRSDAIIAEFEAYLYQLINEKRQHPLDDLLSQLIQSEAEGEKLSTKELVSTIFLFLIAGHETTTNVISNAMLALLRHPDQMKLLQQDPSLIKTALEECLRYQGPLMKATYRWALEDVELGGKLIQRGDEIALILASANRDPEAFTNPDVLDILRQENQHLAFGKGIHFCIGAPLARIEGQLAITTLLRRLPDLHLNVDPQTLTWRPGLFIMGLDRLPLAF